MSNERHFSQKQAGVRDAAGAVVKAVRGVFRGGAQTAKTLKERRVDVDLARRLPERLAEGQQALVKQRGEEGMSLLGTAMRKLPFGIGERYTQAATKVYEKVRSADVAVSGPLSRIPVVGGLFRSTERLPGKVLKETPAGPIREMIERPTSSLIAPAEKAQRIAVPLLASSALGGLGGVAAAHVASPQRAAVEGKRKKMNESAGQVMKAAAVVMRQREELLEKTSSQLSQHKLAMSDLAGQVEQHELEKKASNFVLDMVRRGVVSIDNFEEKVAEIVEKGEQELQIQRAALAMIDKDASSLGTAEDRSGGGEDTGEGNPVLEYLEEYAYTHDG